MVDSKYFKEIFKSETDFAKDTIKCPWNKGTKEKNPHTELKFNTVPPKILPNILEGVGTNMTPMVRMNKIP